MTARGRVNSSADWDPMRDDYNDTSYDAQYQDNETSGRSAQSFPLDHRKLYVTNLPAGLNEQGLKTAFEKYGQVEQAFLSRDPMKKYALIRYETAAEARVAMMKLNRTEPLNLHVNLAHARGNNSEGQNGTRDRAQKDNSSFVSSNRDKRSRNQDDHTNGDEDSVVDAMGIDHNFHLELEKIKLDKLRVQEEQLKCRQKMMLLQLQRRPNNNPAPTTVGSSRRLLPDGRVIVQERVQENDTSFNAGAGDSNETTCSCRKSWTKNEGSDEGSSTPSTCVICSDDRSALVHSKRNSTEKSDESKFTEVRTSEYSSKDVTSNATDVTVSKTNYKESEISQGTVSKLSDASKKCEAKKCACRVRSDMTCDLKFRDFYSDSDDDEFDETNRLIQLRNSDYLDVVDDQLKLVIALAGYPKSKMCLRQMDVFQRCLTDVINMQLKANLLQKMPSFFDYYLNRGAIVCICKDLETRDWMVRISPGLQERMSTNLVLLNAKVKRLCLAVLKIPRSSWPATAQDCFKLLHYFNPSLSPSSWKIYAQKVIDDVECTSFLIDRVSGEIIRGPNFKNVIDYEQMQFELTGYTEIYYECLLAGMEEDLSSVASRVKLLEEIKSANTTPRIASTVSVKSIDSAKPIQIEDLIEKVVTDVSESKLDVTEGIVEEFDSTEDKIEEFDDTEDKIEEFEGTEDKIKEFDGTEDKIEEVDDTEDTIEEFGCTEYKIEEFACTEDKIEEFDGTEDKNEEVDGTEDKIEELGDTTTRIEEFHEIDKTDELNDTEDKEISNVKTELESAIDGDVLKKIKKENIEVLVWADETPKNREAEREDKPFDYLNATNTTTTSLVALSEKSESVVESCDNLLINSSTINIDSNRGIAYHRRTNYLHVENELKVAITLEGYPQNKLEGTHIRRLKSLFKEYLNKDMKSQRFPNLIIPKFQDIYLSNGAVIYICDSLETRDYLTELLPKFICSTGLKLTFRDVTSLVRYTRIVMRLSKEQANVESLEILSYLQEKYPGLKPDCWKYYSDVAGKQKRQFGVDPESLDIIRSPNFDPIFKGEKLIFRIIDRQKRDVSYEERNEMENATTKKLRYAVVKNMYVPIDQEITNAPLTRIRTNHYSDLIADDLKIYVGPMNYPDSRIDELQFHAIKRAFEKIVMESLEKGELADNTIPKYHDMYLFDGVIFIICQNMDSRVWIEQNVKKVNELLHINLKSTEFRGAVGIVSMVVRTDKDIDGVIAVLQQQNPRLRTKFWRKISTVKNDTKLDAVLQIDKLSAQVISDPNFNKLVGYETAQFKLGHLQSLIKPKASLEELTKAHVHKLEKKLNKAIKVNKKKKKSSRVVATVDKHDFYSARDMSDNGLDESPKFKKDQTQKETKYNSDPNVVAGPAGFNKEFAVPEVNYQSKIIIKIPLKILPDSEDDLNIIFDILEDKNPGLNTEIWQVFTESVYPSNGKFIVFVDKQSLSVIKNKDFDPHVGGEKLMFYF